MSVREPWRKGLPQLQARPGLIWLALIAGFSAWIAWRLGAFDLWVTVSLPDGTTSRIPNTFASVDHPFHAGRAELLRRSLADGRLLRWIGSHQGGYPVEFYPLGAAWIEVVAWGAALGALPIMAIHKLVVIGVFLLPVTGFALLARADRLPGSVPFVALVMHASVRGWWWSGGYHELIEWGLLTNVLSASLLPLVIGLLYCFVKGGDRRFAAGAAVVATIAVYTNVRSVFPLAAIVAGLGLGIVESGGWSWSALLRYLRNMGLVAIPTLLLLAPLLIPLARFSDLYFFVHYEGYADLTAYRDATVQAVSSPVLVLAAVGAAFALADRRHTLARSVVLILAVYMAGTVLAGTVDLIGELVSQLEAPRLMPFQRLLIIYLAAFGAWRGVDRVFGMAERQRALIAGAAMVVIAALFISAYILAWLPGIPKSDQANVEPITTAYSSVARLESAVKLADQEAISGAAILILGSSVSWHDHFWAQQWSDRNFFFDDWLWYWQKDHVGDYNPEIAHAYDRDESALSEAFLRQHAIGAVIVTGDAAQAAASSPLLTRISDGTYSTYLVQNPLPVIVAPRVEVDDQVVKGTEITGRAESAVSSFTVRHNWFPRWSATVDGNPARITKDAAGYMQVTSEAPGTILEVRYGLDRWDWLARVLCAIGVFVTVAFLAAPNGLTQWLPARLRKDGRAEN